MQEEEDNKPAGISDSQLPENQYSDPNPVTIPKDTVQEQIPPVRPTVSKKAIIKKLLIALGVLLLIAAAGFVIWKFVLDKKDELAPVQTDQNQVQATDSESSNEQLQPEELTEDFKSDFLRLEFKYPQAWKVTESDNVILVKSPSFKLNDMTDNESISYFKIYIKRGANDADGKYLANAYAIEQSQKITYTEPASGQRKDTNLTDFGNATPDNFAFFVVQGNFNLAKGDTLGPKFAQEPDSFLIAGGFANDELTDGLATKTISIESFADNQAYLTAVEIVKSLKLK